jgi:hypothetical protein
VYQQAEDEEKERERSDKKRKFTNYMREGLFQRLKVTAAQQKRPMTELLEEAVEDLLGKLD